METAGIQPRPLRASRPIEPLAGARGSYRCGVGLVPDPIPIGPVVICRWYRHRHSLQHTKEILTLRLRLAASWQWCGSRRPETAARFSLSRRLYQSLGSFQAWLGGETHHLVRRSLAHLPGKLRPAGRQGVGRIPGRQSGSGRCGE